MNISKIGDPQFRVMCNMWGVEKALQALKRMCMTVTQEQIDAARAKEAESQERWNNVVKGWNDHE